MLAYRILRLVAGFGWIEILIDVGIWSDARSCLVPFSSITCGVSIFIGAFDCFAGAGIQSA
jgi:hypothetical protein